MPPSETPSPPVAGRERRADVSSTIWPIVWIREVGAALLLVGALIALTNPASTAAWSAWKAGLLLVALGLFVFAGVPGALLALRHPWATRSLKTVTQSFTYPRLVGLAELWASAVVPGWLSAKLLLQVHDPLMAITYAVFLVGLGPMLALLLFDRR
jgi:hypothetical protein